jgi:hypothetical protein
MSSGRDRDKGAKGKKGRSVFSELERGRTCVGSFARANAQHPQVEEAVKLKKRGTATHTLATIASNRSRIAL